MHLGLAIYVATCFRWVPLDYSKYFGGGKHGFYSENPTYVGFTMFLFFQ